MVDEGSSEKGLKTRRRFLGDLAKAGAVGVVGAVGVGELKHEQVLAKEGRFETDLAVWHPIYERHDEHEQAVAPENIPADLKALSFEGTQTVHGFVDGENVTYNILQAPLWSLLVSKTLGHDTMPRSLKRKIPDDTLEYLKRTGMIVALGDAAGNALDFETLIKMKDALVARENIGKIFGALGLVAAGGGRVAKAKGIKRREFLKKGGLASFAVGVGLAVPASLREEIHDQVMKSIKDNSSYQRIWARLHTLDSNMTPEVLNDMFREILQASKLMTLAEEMNESSGNEKPTIGYNWHLAHRGIEDWLRVDRSIVRSCILAFPDSVLRQVIENNNGDPRCLYAMRLAKVPQSLKVLSEDDSGTKYTYDDEEPVEDAIIEDRVLAKALKKRGLF
jgi:hypothetical protein